MVLSSEVYRSYRTYISFTGGGFRPPKPTARDEVQQYGETCQRTRTTMLFTFSELPVARCKSAIALFRSVCAFNSNPRDSVNAFCRSNTRNVVDCPASNFRCSLANCCSLAVRVAVAARKRASERRPELFARVARVAFPAARLRRANVRAALPQCDFAAAN